MGKRKRYQEYWKERLNYDYNKEYNIYKYLCGGMRHKWQEKKIPKEKRFETYSAWKEYIMTSYETSNLNELKEFYRYLNRCRRIEKSAKGMRSNFSLPLYTVLATLVITQTDWGNMISTSKEFTDNMVGYGWSLGVIISILAIIWAITMIVFVLLPIFFMVIIIFKTVIIEGEIEAFYEDYIEIMDEVITQKEALREEKIEADKG